MSKHEMLDTFKKHVDAELAGDLETTMATMTADPHLHNVPSMVGGVGRDGVRNFYKNRNCPGANWQVTRTAGRLAGILGLGSGLG
jgi:hypothetical protein